MILIIKKNPKQKFTKKNENRRSKSHKKYLATKKTIEQLLQRW